MINYFFNKYNREFNWYFEYPRVYFTTSKFIEKEPNNYCSDIGFYIDTHFDITKYSSKGFKPEYFGSFVLFGFGILFDINNKQLKKTKIHGKIKRTKRN